MSVKYRDLKEGLRREDVVADVEVGDITDGINGE